MNYQNSLRIRSVTKRLGSESVKMYSVLFPYDQIIFKNSKRRASHGRQSIKTEVRPRCDQFRTTSV